MQNRKALLLLSALCLLVLALSQCVNTTPSSNDPRGPAFAGSSTCRQCHQPIYDTYIKSAHFNTTQPVSEQNLLAHLDSTSRFPYNDSTWVQVHKGDSGLYQTAYVNGRALESHRMDILFGVQHAQTFLYWNGNRTFELPLSYYTGVQQWGTSPGFSATNINFKRFIGANCFECHSSNINKQLNASTAGIEEVLDKNSLIYGIDCERCHGPALAHVDFHNKNPNSKQPKYITQIASLTRQQQLDVCAVCHSGNNKLQEKSTFKFTPGDTLAHFFTIWHTDDTTSNFDVHGNQYQLLSRSKCFTQSNSITCSTCHNPHANTTNNIQAYSSICASCHKQVEHSFDQTNGNALKNNCIDCHMPSQPSQAITFRLAGSHENSAYMLRTHRIAVYPTKKDQ